MEFVQLCIKSCDIANFAVQTCSDEAVVASSVLTESTCKREVRNKLAYEVCCHTNYAGIESTRSLAQAHTRLSCGVNSFPGVTEEASQCECQLLQAANRDLKHKLC